MNSQEIRQKYLDFFQNKKHSVISSASLLPENDPTTLFISSGMQPLIPYLLGEQHPQGKRLVNSQKCFRSEDIEEVGDNRHDTFFEMLGNWSLGDYFKEEQLLWVYEFLVEELGLDPKRLYATVFRGSATYDIGKDEESVKILKRIFKKYGIDAQSADMSEINGINPGEHIFYYPEKKNWWSRSGMPENMPIGEPGGPDSEIFYDLGKDLQRHENSVWRNQPCHLNCDCGRFVEIGNSVFMEYIRTEKGFEKLRQKNVDFGGGLERIVMVAQAKNNIFETDLFINSINKLEKLSNKKYCDNKPAFEIIADHIKAAAFIMGDDGGAVPSNTDQGYIIRRLLRRAIRYGKKIGIVENFWTKDIAASIIDFYQNTYPELDRNKTVILQNIETEEIKFSHTLEKGIKEFEKIEISCQTTGKKITGEDLFYLYQTYGFPVELSLEELDRRNIHINSAELLKDYAIYSQQHQELSRTAAAGKFKGGLADHSEKTTKLHTAAHLLLEALRRVLGDHIFQRGANITAERLRFDFSHKNKMTDEEKKQTENIVNEEIAKKLAVSLEEMTLEKAKVIGATGIFESKYGEKVKVYTIHNNEEVFSKEICGGPHVENIGILGKFKIIKEESSSSGVRRIKAILE
jgi:alanyl-tRNA synthetase